MRELESEELEEVERILARAHRRAPSASRRDDRDARRARRARLAVRARALRRCSSRARRRRSCPRARASRFTTAGIRCCSRRASTSCRSISRWSPSERTLLVSGPNTGGKTVLLKALGLISALAQSGIPAPVGAESRIADLRRRVRRRRRRAVDRGESLDVQRAPEEPRARFCGSRRRDSLVLIDELGSGTDPHRRRGARLGDSRGAHGARHDDGRDDAPRHAQGARDAGARRRQRVAAVRRRRARADYRLIKGIPGRSYGISDRAAAQAARGRRRARRRAAAAAASATSPR